MSKSLFSKWFQTTLVGKEAPCSTTARPPLAIEEARAQIREKMKALFPHDDVEVITFHEALKRLGSLGTLTDGEAEAGVTAPVTGPEPDPKFAPPQDEFIDIMEDLAFDIKVAADRVETLIKSRRG